MMKKFTNYGFADCTSKMADLKVSADVRQRSEDTPAARSRVAGPAVLRPVVRRSKSDGRSVKLQYCHLEEPHGRQLLEVGIIQTRSPRLTNRPQAQMHLSPPLSQPASASPTPRRESSQEQRINNSCEGLPSNQAVISPGGAIGSRHIDTTRSLARYSLFGPNVAPFWEYYTTVPGVASIPLDTPSWKVSIMQKKNCQVVHIYMRKEEEMRKRKEFERIEQERRACVPEWMREIAERRREKKLAQSIQTGPQSCEKKQKNKQDLPLWQKELIRKKRRQHSIKSTTSLLNST